MLIKDDMLREVIARTLRITEEEITEEKLLELRNLSVRYAGVSLWRDWNMRRTWKRWTFAAMTSRSWIRFAICATSNV